MIQPYKAYSWSGLPGPIAGILPTVHDSLTPVVTETAAPMGATDGKALAALPVGQRALIGQNHTSDMLGTYDMLTYQGQTYKGPWYTKAIPIKYAAMTAYFSAIAAAGGTLDLYLLDDENSFGKWNDGDGTVANYDAIVADPRFPAFAVAMKYNGPTPITGQSLQTWVYASETNGANFEYACIQQKYLALQAAVVAPLMKQFPGASYTNYDDIAVAPQFLGQWMDSNGHWYLIPQPPGLQSPVLYGYDGQLYGPHPEYNSPFGELVRSINLLRIPMVSSSSPLLAWTCLKDTFPATAEQPSPLSGTPYFDEMLRHLLMHSPSVAIFDPSPSAAGLADLSAIISEVQGIVPIPGTLATAGLAAVSDGAVATVVAVGNNRHARVTFAPGASSITFVVDGQLITIAAAGRIGCWVSWTVSSVITITSLSM